MTTKEGAEMKKTLLYEKSGVKQKQSIVVISASNLCVWCCISLMAPFFPLEAERKGASQTVIGFIYSCSELVMLLASPCFGYLIPKSGARFFYIAGLFVFGCCTFLFGLMNISPPGATFIALCFAVRIIQALGSASITTASYVIIGMTFPDRIGTAFGVLEMVTGVGFLIGPTIGGGLYELGGFGLPFWVLGACVVVCACVSCAVLPPQDHVVQDTSAVSCPSMLKLFRSPLVWYGCVCSVVALASVTVYVPVYARHLLQVPTVPMMTTGLVCAAVCSLFFGPAPFFTFMKPTVWSTGLVSALFGLSIAPILISAIRCTVQGAMELDLNDNRHTFSMAGGVIQSSTCLGTFIGPSVGGVVTEKLGFGWTLVVGSGILLLPVVAFCPYAVYNLRERRKTKYKLESSPLQLSSNDVVQDKQQMYETFKLRDN